MKDLVYGIDDRRHYNGIPELVAVEVERRGPKLVKLKDRSGAFDYNQQIPVERAHATPEAAIAVYVAKQRRIAEAHEEEMKKARERARIAESILPKEDGK